MFFLINFGGWTLWRVGWGSGKSVQMTVCVKKSICESSLRASKFAQKGFKASRCNSVHVEDSCRNTSGPEDQVEFFVTSSIRNVRLTSPLWIDQLILFEWCNSIIEWAQRILFESNAFFYRCNHITNLTMRKAGVYWRIFQHC